MFQVIIRKDYKSTDPVQLHIEGCPLSGVAAVDFRRRHGLPEAPDATASLPWYEFSDEAFVRENPALANEHADIALYRFSQKSCFAGREGVVERSPSCFDLRVAQPEAIAAYLKEQTPETAKALLRSVWTYRDRTLATATAELEARREREAERARKLAEARELLAPELEAYRLEVVRLTALVRELEGEEGDGE